MSSRPATQAAPGCGSLTGSHGLAHLEASSFEQAVEWLAKELASVPQNT